MCICIPTLKRCHYTGLFEDISFFQLLARFKLDIRNKSNSLIKTSSNSQSFCAFHHIIQCWALHFTLTLIWVGFLCFRYEGWGIKFPPLVWNSSELCYKLVITQIYVQKINLIGLFNFADVSIFFAKNQCFLAKIVPLLKAIVWELCFRFFSSVCRFCKIKGLMKIKVLQAMHPESGFWIAPNWM